MSKFFETIHEKFYKKTFEKFYQQLTNHVSKNQKKLYFNSFAYRNRIIDFFINDFCFVLKNQKR